MFKINIVFEPYLIGLLETALKASCSTPCSYFHLLIVFVLVSGFFT